MKQQKKVTPEKSFQKGMAQLDKIVSRVKAAQRRYATFSQEQVDRIFRAAAIAAAQHRIPLAKLAVEETGMGVMEDKVIKNQFASEYIYNQYKDTPTCGVLSDDDAFGYRQIAEPIGVIAAVMPLLPKRQSKNRGQNAKTFCILSFR